MWPADDDSRPVLSDTRYSCHLERRIRLEYGDALGTLVTLVRQYLEGDITQRELRILMESRQRQLGHSIELLLEHEVSGRVWGVPGRDTGGTQQRTE